MAVQGIFDTLPSPSPPAGGSTQSVFEDTILMLDEYSKYEPNFAPEKHNFRLLRQLPVTVVSHLQRWAVIFSGYDYVIEHLPGHENSVADCLSRNPLKLSPEQESAVINATEDNAHDPVEDLPVSAADVAMVYK